MPGTCRAHDTPGLQGRIRQTIRQVTFMAREKKARAGSSSGANLGFEAKLWATADTLRGSMDAAEYSSHASHN